MQVCYSYGIQIPRACFGIGLQENRGHFERGDVKLVYRNGLFVRLGHDCWQAKRCKNVVGMLSWGAHC